MESSGPRKSSLSNYTLRDLFSRNMLLVAWLPVIIISVLHYATGSHLYWAHDVLRRLYYPPILFAAFSRGWRGGLSVALLSSVTYAPHAFVIMGVTHDPGTTINKLLEIILYNVIGIMAGVLADREARRRLQAERAILQQQRMAEQLVRAGRLAALGELVAGIAHEIKNPLHTIKGTAEIIDEFITKEAEQASMWKLMQQEIERLERIAERFLSFARPTKPDLRRHTYAEVYQRIGELLTAQVYRSSGVQLKTIPLSEMCIKQTIHADRDQLAQIILNISSNAMSAMGQSGTLKISGNTREELGSSWLTLRVENDGPIILEEDLERIFDPFYSRSKEGTGLGLSIAQRIAESHNGFIEVENTGEERGVAFTVVLPLTE